MQAIALEEAETQIRKVTKDEFFAQTRKAAIDQKVFRIINEALKQIKIPSLKDAAQKSLLNFYIRQYEELQRSFWWQLSTLTALFLLNGKTLTGRDIKPTTAQKAAAVQTLTAQGYDRSRLLGVPLQKFSQDYINKNVKPALDRLAKQFAKDPEDISGRNSLRNKAEMAVRWQEHEDTIQRFKSEGVRLVICSTHADCSGRCRPWQGRVYSLDGTSGTTDDGRRFVPLETATDIYYTTKAGKQWKNGLLGFNCRHFLVPYKSGYRFPKPNVAEERKQYAITLQQRELERNVRHWRTVAIENKNLDREKYLDARAKAIAWNREYIAFSKQNNRAYYPSRTKII